ncbi:MAG: hypothetical protein WEB53_15545 [Akkermansiaceae bacterium]
MFRHFVICPSYLLLASGPMLPLIAARGCIVPQTDAAAFDQSRWIESSSTLAAGSWSLRRVGTIYQASGSLSSDFTDAATPAQEFYRVATGP